ncbi:hypothetical protein BKA65DRAFT_521463 [Rhexocercosporidium sp. MPI-PUGE-AT-0058]|nr:hypothetical protein BKA65DRAFT_521463 [Rhexocercosporidium sp. MPI-PUGE-AT-0058]
MPDSPLAAPRNLHEPTPPRLPHKLHLPPLLALQQHPNNNNDDQPSSKETLNLVLNLNVSLLVHDWVSHRPPTTRSPWLRRRALGLSSP